uniref:hypothetical protein n=1 Tax=Candidatus Cryptobacteroides bacterium TaxID=3085639 RepID=UPI0040272868
MSIPTAIQAKEAKGTKEVKEYGDSEVTLHNELKHKSIFLRDFTTAAQMLRQVLRRCFGRCCDRAVSGVWRVGIGVVWNAGIMGMDDVAGNKLSINEISILVVRYWAPRECLC